MRTLQRLSMAVLLALALVPSAMAGIIGTPPEPPPAPGIMETPPSSLQSSLVGTVAVAVIQIAISGR